MENDLSVWGRYLRVGISGLLFIGLVIGGGAAALTALGAGLNALAGGHVAVSQQIASVPSATALAQTATTPTKTTTAPSQATSTEATSGSTTASSTPAAASGGQQSGSGLTSPVGEAIDTGGVVIGEHVQSAFGNLLSHVLNVLFMEQDTATGGGSQP